MELLKVDVKNTFSFFNVATDDVEKVEAVFESFMLKGRHVNVEITKDQKSGGGGGKKGGDKSRDRKPRKRFDKSKSSDFKGKKPGGSNVKSSFERRRKKN